jgi:hypothetical protein
LFASLFENHKKKITFYLPAHLFQKSQKNICNFYSCFNLAIMSNPAIIMSPEEIIFTFKQGSEESFKEACTRISESHNKIEPSMTLSLFVRSFYFGLVLCYRYALDYVVGGDFLSYDGDQAFNAIKKLIATYRQPTYYG